MTKVESARLKLWRGFMSHAFRALMNVITVIALVLGGYAVYHQGEEAKSQANHLRVVVCGIVEPYASLPAQPTTNSGLVLKRAFQDARGPNGADCTPNPTDGK